MESLQRTVEVGKTNGITAPGGEIEAADDALDAPRSAWEDDEAVEDEMLATSNGHPTTPLVDNSQHPETHYSERPFTSPAKSAVSDWSSSEQTRRV